MVYYLNPFRILKRGTQVLNLLQLYNSKRHPPWKKKTEKPWSKIERSQSAPSTNTRGLKKMALDGASQTHYSVNGMECPTRGMLIHSWRMNLMICSTIIILGFTYFKVSLVNENIRDIIWSKLLGVFGDFFYSRLPLGSNILSARILRYITTRFAIHINPISISRMSTHPLAAPDLPEISARARYVSQHSALMTKE